MTTVYYPCEALVDQNRYIGDDPIGHSCGNRAEVQIGNSLLCKECSDLIPTGRISFDALRAKTLPEIKIEAWKRTIMEMIYVKEDE